MTTRLAAKARRSFDRDRDLPLIERIRKAERYLVSVATAPLYLRRCTVVGSGTRTVGRPRINNHGIIEIGADCALNSQFSPVELTALSGGSIRIGRGARINFGTSITAATQVTIGEDVSIGPYSIVSDNESGAPDVGAAPIEVGDHVWLASRVTLLPGSRIGEGAVITAGSIVSGDIPPRVVAGGIPARVLRSIGGNTDGPPVPAAVARPVAAAGAASAATQPVVSMPALTGAVLADFTIGDLAVRLADAADAPVMTVAAAPFCQTVPMLLQGATEGAADFAVVWTRPELVSPAFQRVLEGTGATEAELVADVDGFVAQLEHGAESYRFVFVPTWVLPAHHRGLGLIDSRAGGLSWAIGIMNHRLSSRLGEAKSIFVLNAERWLRAAPGGGASAKGWYVGKVPFHADVFAEAARDIKAAVRGLTGHARKLLVLDLDDTLWGGIVGDAGWENLQLGGHDAIGESFVDFQRAIKALSRRGVVLGVVSKNTEAVALDAMRSHPEMVLKPEDIAGWRINWHDKAQNVAELAAELNLGLQSVVFIDDNPVERARVREALPEVLVPEWPEDKLLYTSEFLSLRCFDTPVITREDAERGKLYAEERQRAMLRQQVSSMDDWLASLDIHLRVEPLGAANLARACQLLNKTNQMNLTTRRLSEGELMAWAGESRHAFWAVTVSDRFGSAGLTGLIGVEARDDTCRIVDFVLSCRVMGRRVEEALTHVAVEWARSRELSTVVAEYLATSKNKPCHDFWKGSGFAADDDARTFSWSAAERYPLPTCIALEWESHASA